MRPGQRSAVSTKTQDRDLPPVVAVISEKTTHMPAILISISLLRPTLAGRNANANEHANENIALVAVISVVSNCDVIPLLFSILPR